MAFPAAEEPAPEAQPGRTPPLAAGRVAGAPKRKFLSPSRMLRAEGTPEAGR